MNAETPVKINVCVEGSDDWLFGDLRRGFQRAKVKGVQVIASETPIQDADAWTFIRTDEAVASPDMRRSVVCIHDLYEHDDMYKPGQIRWRAAQAGGLVLCHPEQRRILQEAGIDLSGKAVLERPLGALHQFTVRNSAPRDSFRVGWVGREHPRKRTAWFAEAMKYLSARKTDVAALVIGKDLEPLCARIRSDGGVCKHFDRTHTDIHAYPALYQTLDCLVITSSTEAGPLPLFEALATGLPVVSTAVGWAPELAARAPEFVLLADDPNGIAAHLETIYDRRHDFFDARFEIASVVEAYRLDEWFVDVLELCARLARAWPS